MQRHSGKVSWVSGGGNTKSFFPCSPVQKAHFHLNSYFYKYLPRNVRSSCSFLPLLSILHSLVVVTSVHLIWCPPQSIVLPVAHSPGGPVSHSVRYLLVRVSSCGPIPVVTNLPALPHVVPSLWRVLLTVPYALCVPYHCCSYWLCSCFTATQARLSLLIQLHCSLVQPILVFFFFKWR
jgi:hypothetical protein